MSFIIKKGEKVPKSFTKSYNTIFDYQDSIKIDIIEGESEFVKNNCLLDSFKLTNLPARKEGQVEVEVTFKIDENFILSAKAEEKSTGVKSGKEKIQINKINDRPDGKNSDAKPNEDIIEEKYTDLIPWCKKYMETEDLWQRYNILNNYNSVLISNIEKLFENDFKNNDFIIEKYFIFLNQLFLSYNQILKYKNQKTFNITDSTEQEIYTNIMKYLKKIEKNNPYYLKNLITIFKTSSDISDIFNNLIFYAMQTFNRIGQEYLDNRRNFSRYQAKKYFGESIQLYKDNNIEQNEFIIKNEISEKIKNAYKESLSKLKEINSGAFFIFNITKKNGELFDPRKFQKYKQTITSNSIKPHTGFTQEKKIFQISNLNNIIEDYNIILDQFEKALAELDSSQNIDIHNNFNIQEERAICMGSIVAINLGCLRRKNFDQCNEYIESCITIAKNIHKNNENDCKWYEQILELKTLLNDRRSEYIKKEEETWKNKYEPELNIIRRNLDEKYKKNSDKINFIHYILDKHPYKNYNKKEREKGIDWDSINTNLIELLEKEYLPDNCPKYTLKQRFDYEIYEKITEKLHDIIC